MRVKTVKQSVSTLLVVADPKINRLYNCAESEAIQLAKIVNPFNMGAYEVEDWRLTQSSPLSPYSPPKGYNVYQPQNEAERKKILSHLHTYEEHEGSIIWDSFDSFYFDGDNPKRLDRHNEIAISLTARFTYEGARERFREIREFWQAWDNPNLEQARIVNPYRQIDRHTVMLWACLGDNYSIPHKKNKP